MINRAYYDDLTDEERVVLHHAAENCVTASRGISRIIEASDRGLAGLMNQMEVTALTPEQRASMAEATQPVFEAHVAENLDEKAGELLELLQTEVAAANSNTYLD